MIETKGSFVIAYDYSEELLKFNSSVVVRIIDRRLKKVRHCAVVERRALSEWFTRMKISYDQRDFMYLLSTTGLMGEIVTDVPDPPDDKDVSKTPKGDFRLN